MQILFSGPHGLHATHVPHVVTFAWVAGPCEHLLSFGRVKYTPGTAGGPGCRDRTLAVAKNRAKMTFFSGGKKITPKKYFFFAYIF